MHILRLDTIHPIISGNKLFKLYYFLKQAGANSDKAILTFGGAYSNHLSATAFACFQLNIKSIGIVRGEKPVVLSHTLIECERYGMQLIFISRETYNNKNEKDFFNRIKLDTSNCIIIPEGGYHPLGAKGAALIMDNIPENNFTHICTSVGTATTLAGILLSKKNNQQVIGFNALKGINDINKRIEFLTGTVNYHYDIIDNYTFGGYAKKTNELIDFMNTLWRDHSIPTDFVYTGKMLFGIFNLIQKEYFPAASKILTIHTGGLQGNKSLPKGTLTF
ncbi:MAG: pyridoxal-phosphate dependent enzyme [Chitinophagaceae bacterium]|nr:pyridoxal-phosphate dependent enzyme [Chitinophagaceae bacterium]